MSDYVLCFGKIGGALILCWDQVVRFNQNPVRRYVMIVAAVIIRCELPDGKFPVNGLTQAREPIPNWSPFKPAPYAIRTAGAKMISSYPLHPKPQVFDEAAANACLPQDWPICSKRSVLSAPPLIR